MRSSVPFLRGAAAIAFAITAISASAQQWTMVFASSPDRLHLARDLPPRYAPLRPQPPISGTLRFQLPDSAVVNGRFVVRIGNEAGDVPLRVAAASVGRARIDGTVIPNSLVGLTFGGRADITLPAGAPAVSDPITVAGPAGAPVVVNIYVPEGIVLNLAGGAAMTLAPNDQTRSALLANAKRVIGRPFVTAVYLETSTLPGSIVALGDSITEANRAERNPFRGWTATLRTRLARPSGRTGLTVINAAILGNRVLTDGMGEAALARLDRDALSVPGIRYLIVFEGINDIGHADQSEVFALTPPLSSAELIAGYRQIIVRAHVRGVKVILATLTPFAGSEVATVPRENIRLAVNAWIRGQHEADGVIDFDRVIRDFARPGALRSDYDSGDHLHPNSAGYRALGESIDLGLFR